jgi:two-component system, OmpR family, phosphate regulon sensor histidine kinase PhoR
MARPQKLIHQLYLSYILIMGIPILIATWYASYSFNKFYQKQTVADLTSRAWLIGSQVQEHITQSSISNIDSLCKALAKKLMTRFTVISPSGNVIGDSEKKIDSMDNHLNRMEVIEALRGNVGVSTRFSQTLMEEMLYTAVPVYVSGKIAAVVRTALPLTSIKAAISRIYARVFWMCVFTAILAAIISLLVSKKISRPINSMKIGAQRFASGDFGGKLPLEGFEETNQLAVALNEMANKLNALISKITGERNKFDAIMSSMTEGVIAADIDQRIISVNRAAASMLGIDRHDVTGKWINDILRNAEIQNFFIKALKAEKPIEKEIVMVLPADDPISSPERYFQLHGNALYDGSYKSIGALLVISEITKIKKLETIRKDFVANVSHELRTPLTSIKGFVETLAAGAMGNPEEAQRFLTILGNQVDRLNTIVEDLLSLSILEQDAEKNTIELSKGRIDKVLHAAIDECSARSLLKEITVECSCATSVVAKIEPSLLQEAIVNLLDNALNYSERNKRVWICAADMKDGSGNPTGEVVISVRDEGIGIAKEHFGRLFERFYRVDKARSRKLGGTGLGLSIVKHIALAHGGRVGVESQPGKGSTFFVYLPQA